MLRRPEEEVLYVLENVSLGISWLRHQCHHILGALHVCGGFQNGDYLMGVDIAIIPLQPTARFYLPGQHSFTQSNEVRLYVQF